MTISKVKDVLSNISHTPKTKYFTNIDKEHKECYVESMGTKYIFKKIEIWMRNKMSFPWPIKRIKHVRCEYSGSWSIQVCVCVNVWVCVWVGQIALSRCEGVGMGCRYGAWGCSVGYGGKCGDSC